MNKYKEMVCLLTSYEEALFKTWALAADKKTLEGLSRPLLIREPETQTLTVNFGRDTIAILNEVMVDPRRKKTFVLLLLLPCSAPTDKLALFR